MIRLLLLALFVNLLHAGQADRIVVNKARREMLLLTNGEVIKSYRVALGRQPVGPKIQEGDMRTPEGVYRISAR